MVSPWDILNFSGSFYPFKSSNFGPKAQVLDGASIHIAAEGEAISPGAAGDAQGAEPIFFFDDLVAM